MQATSNIIDKNWKALIKPNKLDIKSNSDKTIAKVTAEPLEKGFGQTKLKTNEKIYTSKFVLILTSYKMIPV